MQWNTVEFSEVVKAMLKTMVDTKAILVSPTSSKDTARYKHATQETYRVQEWPLRQSKKIQQLVLIDLLEAVNHGMAYLPKEIRTAEVNQWITWKNNRTPEIQRKIFQGEDFYFAQQAKKPNARIVVLYGIKEIPKLESQAGTIQADKIKHEPIPKRMQPKAGKRNEKTNIHSATSTITKQDTTPENAEAKLQASIQALKERLPEKGITEFKKDFASQIGISLSTLNTVLKGVRSPKGEAALLRWYEGNWGVVNDQR